LSPTQCALIPGRFWHRGVRRKRTSVRE
jgi:hypothetical protein